MGADILNWHLEEESSDLEKSGEEDEETSADHPGEVSPEISSVMSIHARLQGPRAYEGPVQKHFKSYPRTKTRPHNNCKRNASAEKVFLIISFICLVIHTPWPTFHLLGPPLILFWHRPWLGILLNGPIHLDCTWFGCYPTIKAKKGPSFFISAIYAA